MVSSVERQPRNGTGAAYERYHGENFVIRTPLKRSSRLQSGGPLRKRRRTRKGQVPEAVLDALWSKRIRERDTYCKVSMLHAPNIRTAEFIGFAGDCQGPIQAAHVYSRKYKAIRHDLDNGLGLCARHHALFHDNPVMAGHLFEAMLSRIELDTLWIKAQAGGKIDRHAVKAYLEAKA